MSGMFCRHNRLTANCVICSREQQQELKRKAPARAARPRTGGSATARKPSASAARSSGRLVTRRLARSADDGYRNPLTPGLRATADAERLAIALTQAARRLEPPGPYPEIATEPDLDQATWLAFLLALAPELASALLAANPPYQGPVELPEARAKAVAAYLAWVERNGGQQRAFTGEESWTPARRFSRVFERLSLPGFGRTARYELLTILGSAGRYPLEPDELHFVEDDATTLAAKRLLVSGDRMLLERRAKELADAAELPIGALDRGLAVWGTPGEHVDLTAEPDPGVAAALGLR